MSESRRSTGNPAGLGPAFLEDELTRPFTGTIAWTSDGRGAEICSDAQAIRIPLTAEVADADTRAGRTVRLVDRIIRLRHERTGVRFTKRHCSRCHGWHLERRP